MQEGKRQKQVGALLMQELSDIFQRLGLGMMDGGLVSLTAVKDTAPAVLPGRYAGACGPDGRAVPETQRGKAT
jgi:ribosome-binding factor A